MATAIVIRSYGDSSVLNPEAINIGAPGRDQLRIRQTGIGVNVHDTYVRSGLYRTLPLPGIPGCEAIGVVEDMGEAVTGYSIGDRVAYVTSGYGAYASERLLDARLALRVPDELQDVVVATNLLRAMTVEMLVAQVTVLKRGDTVLVQAAAGGVGRLLCQWASQLGATVIGTVGSALKAEQAIAAGCDHTILYRQTDFGKVVNDLTDGHGVDVAFDSVGADTFYGSLEAVKATGHLVNFGQSSGAVRPVQLAELAARSLTLSRPILFHYLTDETRYRKMGSVVFDAFLSGAITAAPAREIEFHQASYAHDLLESRNGGGTVLLVP